MSERTDGGEPSRADGGETVSGWGRYFDRQFPLYRYRIPIALVLLVVLLRPVVSSNLLAGYGQIANTMLIWMLFVSGFNLLFGFTGLLSFGHALFLGMGMYSIGIGLAKFSVPFFVAAPIGLILTALVAYAIVKLIVTKGEIYFAMLTIAFGQAGWFIVNFNPGGLTNGSDGMTGVLPAWIETFRGQQVVTFLPDMINDFYFLLGAVVLVMFLLLWQILRSPFGRTLIAIRENDELARSLGVNTTRYKVTSFVMSALFAAVAGILLAISDSGAVLATLHWSISGDAVLMAVLGGMSYFAGPIVGVFTWLLTEDLLTAFEVFKVPFVGIEYEMSDLLTHWRFLLGLLILLIIMSAPKTGLWGLLKNGATRIGDRIAEVIR
jgi:branched-chain amino acid transport system permease protein